MHSHVWLYRGTLSVPFTFTTYTTHCLLLRLFSRPRDRSGRRVSYPRSKLTFHVGCNICGSVASLVCWKPGAVLIDMWISSISQMESLSCWYASWQMGHVLASLAS